MGFSSKPSPLRFLLFLFNTSAIVTLGLNEEGAALISFKGSIREDPEGSMANWNSSDRDPCAWNGIRCSEGKVISISIPKRKLLGSLPSSLGSLSSLRHINFKSNKIYGTIPTELFNPRGIQSLVFYGNSLSGSLPPEIGTLPYLQILDLSKNSMSGSIPISLIQCKRLKTLDLNQNNFTGPLPFGFATSFTALEKLDLSFNRLSGLIPDDVGNLTSLLGTADFSHNLFTGSIPAGLGNLPDKVYIDLSYNNLSGSIPLTGALVNRGPTAFIGNPGLCGPPLRNPCSSTEPVNGYSSIPPLPRNNPPLGSVIDHNSGGSSNNRRGLSKSSVAAIVASDVAGIVLIAMVFFYCYRRAVSSHGNEEDKGMRIQKDCLCFRKDESEAVSEDVEQFDLVSLDQNLGFDLDELLKASAFVMGKSGIGIMYRVVLEDGLVLAVRRLGEGGLQRLKEFQTEVEAIGKIKHPNIVALRAYYWSVEEKLLIYDYIPNGNLTAAIHGRTVGVNLSPLSWDVRLQIMKGIAKGLAFLHEYSPKKYVHGDLKPNNVLLGLNMEPHISDFGLGRLANITGEFPASQPNRMNTDKLKSHYSDGLVNPEISTSLCYQAPEAMKSLKPSQKWDVYSYGVILLELISGRSPVFLSDTSEMDLVQWIQFCIEEKKPLLYVLDPILAQELEKEDEIITVLKIALACVQTDPDGRPSMRQVSDIIERLSTAP